MSDLSLKISSSIYPLARMRRNRRHDWIRDLVAETSLAAKDFIWSIFVRENSLSPEISSMPAIYRYSVDELTDAVGIAGDLGLRAIALFPVIESEKRTHDARELFNSGGVLYKAIQVLKKNFPHIGIITDPALDSFTDHGHDGLYINDDVPNDESVQVICQHALLQAQAGADMVAPSDMMDGRVGEIRKLLDQKGYHDVGIMSYAAKYASNFYAPFREALGSDHCLKKGHKRTYQMDPANVREALREVALDLSEGADCVMIKPGLPYLDVIRQVKDRFLVPTFAFHVSGEYAMLKVAAEAGMLSYEKTLIEMMTCFKRAGADGVITYSAVDMLKLLKQG
ncbi:delta-aminolevulinic acid dehydratase [Caedimonas varicaedens]|uniref:Delta-aminolevulinic acid dehydratase n=1 Tax=Caedimonas varicaedens TaxID=1629334 RepID=A0A0K8MD52_9PROT|nr:delta-aminolevulinic acid dehydratase [Caedimonas varicaedens]